MRGNVLSRFRDGDESAVAEVYAEFGGAVFTVTLSILNDRGLAADAAQQTFVKAWRKADTFDSSRDFAPWIYSIARRTAIDILRSEQRRARTAAHADPGVVEMPGIEDVWEHFEVRRALDELPGDERAVIRLTLLEGHSHTQAAEVLGIAVGTVKSRSHRARQRLAESLRHLVDQ